MIIGRVIERSEQRPGFRLQTWHFVWDEFGHLRQVDTPNGERWHYRYDAFGRRTAKQCNTTPSQQAPRQHFLWLGSKLIERWDEHAQSATNTASGAPTKAPAVTRWHYRSGSFTPLAQETLSRPDDPASQCYPLVCDPNGTPHSVWSSSGEMLWRAEHTLWGAAQPRQPQWSRPIQPQNAAPDCPLRFAGQWHDHESGLHYNLHRYYDPASGQYLSPDPLGLAGGLRTHAYVHDPLQWMDPWGLAGCPIPRGNNPYQTRIDSKISGRPDPAFSIDTHTFPSGTVTSKGGIRNSQEFWEQWTKLQPESLSKGNLYRINELGLSPKIDKTWVKTFPEHSNHAGETITHHHVDFGPYAIPVPASTHVGSGGVWHTK